METFIPTSFADLGDAIRFTNNTTSIIVTKENRALVAKIFSNFVSQPVTEAPIDGIKSSTGDPAKSESSSLIESSVTLTSRQLLDLATTPVKIVPEPGSGKYVEILSLTFVLDAGATPYVDNAEFASFIVSYNNVGNAVTFFAAGDLVTSSVDKVQSVVPTNPPNNSSDVVGKPVVLMLDKAITTGTGQLAVEAIFRIRTA